VTGLADKAASRAAQYRREIASLQAAGRQRDAFYEAIRWLRSEAAHVNRHRPGEAEELYRQLTTQIDTLAAAIPAFRAPQPDRRRHP
jgi:hypothetical protein